MAGYNSYPGYFPSTSGGGGGSENLQQVTDNGNTTSNVIFITGMNKFPTTGTGLIIGPNLLYSYNADTGEPQQLGIFSDNINIQTASATLPLKLTSNNDIEFNYLSPGVARFKGNIEMEEGAVIFSANQAGFNSNGTFSLLNTAHFPGNYNNVLKSVDASNASIYTEQSQNSNFLYQVANYDNTDLGISGLSYIAFNYTGWSLGVSNILTSENYLYSFSKDGLGISTLGAFGMIKADNVTIQRIYQLPNQDGTFALTTDIGITSLNGLTDSVQSFAIGTNGSSPNWDSASSIHTLNIPLMANTGVTAGLLGSGSQNIPGDKIFTGTLNTKTSSASVPSGIAFENNTGNLGLIGKAGSADSTFPDFSNDLVTATLDHNMTFVNAKLTGGTGAFRFADNLSSGNIFLAFDSSLFIGNSTNNAFTGSLSVGSDFPSASTIFDAVSTTKGLGIPSMTSIQRTAITASSRNGMLVYQNDNTPAVYASIAGSWSSIISGTGVSGKVAYWDSISSQTNNANFSFSTNIGGSLSIGTTTSISNLNIGATAQSSGSNGLINIIPANHTNQTAGTELNSVIYNSHTLQWAAGGINTQREWLINPVTYSFVSGSIITNASMFYSALPVQGSNATILNTYSGWFGGQIRIDGDIRLIKAAAASIGTFDSNTLNIATNSQTRISITSVGNQTHTQNVQNTSNTFVTYTQAAHTGGMPVGLVWTGGAHTGLTAGSEIQDWNVNLNRIVQRATGGVSLQRAVLFQAPTYSFVGSSIVTTCATVAITNQPQAGTNASILNPYALLIQSGNLGVADQLKILNAGGGLWIKEGTNATMGTATLSAGTITVDTTKVTANSRIFPSFPRGTLTNLGNYRETARVPGASFTITSDNPADSSTFDWVIIEPA